MTGNFYLSDLSRIISQTTTAPNLYDRLALFRKAGLLADKITDEYIAETRNAMNRAKLIDSVLNKGVNPDANTGPLSIDQTMNVISADVKLKRQRNAAMEEARDTGEWVQSARELASRSLLGCAAALISLNALPLQERIEMFENATPRTHKRLLREAERLTK